MAPDDTWTEWSKHVLAELERLNVWCSNIDKQLGNHVTHIEHRLTEMETTMKNTKWILGILFSMVIGIFGMLAAILIR